jgi:alpha-glucosidase (family GH31 glycosyl hydrolase)
MDVASSAILGRARFTAVTADCLRLEYAEDGSFIDAPSTFAVNREARVTLEVAQRTASALIAQTARLRLTYLDDGRPFHEGNLRVEIQDGDRTVSWHPGLPGGGNLGGALPTLDGISGPVPVQPGLLSRDGWFLLDDSARPLLREDTGWWQARPGKHLLDWYLFGYGRSYRAAFRALTALSGPVPLPRRYALGSWYSRYWPYTSRDYRAIVDEYAEHGYPLDVLVMDMDWHRRGWTGWSWNRDLLPDAESLLAELHRRGVAVTLNVHPADGVGAHEDTYPAFMRALGRDPARQEVLPFDPWDQAYMTALFQQVHAPLEAAGVDFWWLDWQQVIEGLEPMRAENLLHWMNRLYFQHAAGAGGSPARRGLSFSRWGGWGDHRHPIHFSGDCHTGWPMLAFAVPFTVSSGNAGLFFWSHDIGGHLGPRDDECFTRWVQFGALSASLRLHAMRAADLDRRPWTYSAASRSSTAAAFALRGRLFPYLYGSAAQSCRESVPLLRPMYLDHPDGELAYQLPQQYLLGDDLLVAPVVAPGLGPQKIADQAVWFPPGTAWYHLLTGERFEGGQLRLVLSELDSLPVFVRAGVPLPLREPSLRPATAPTAELVVRIYPGPEGAVVERVLYEDDGVTTAYRSGACASTPVSCRRSGDSFTVAIGPTGGSHTGQPAARALVVELGGTGPASSVQVGGVAAASEYDATLELNRVRVPRRSLASPALIEISAGVSDGRAQSRRRQAETSAGLLAVGGAGAPVAQCWAAGVAAVPTLGGPAGTGAPAVWLFDDRGALEGRPLRCEIVDEWDGGEGPPVLEPRWEGVVHPRPGAPVRLAPEGLPSLEGEGYEIDKRRLLVAMVPLASGPVVLRRVIAASTATPILAWRVGRPIELDDPRELATRAAPSRTGPRLVRADPDGTVHLAALRADDGRADGRDHFVVAEAAFYSAHDQDAVLLLGGEGPVAVWLDDVPVGGAAEMHPAMISTRAIALPVRHGINRLRVAVGSRGERWMVRARVKARRALVELDPARFEE